MASLLLYDDDAESAEVLTILLQKRGFEVFRPTGVGAIHTMAREVRPNLILLDMCVPDIDTLALIRQLTADQHRVIGFSGMQGWREEALQAGCSGFLDKPFAVRELMLVLDALGLPHGLPLS